MANHQTITNWLKVRIGVFICNLSLAVQIGSLSINIQHFFFTLFNLEELQSTRLSESKYKQQLIDAQRREKMLIRRLAAKEHEMQEYIVRMWFEWKNRLMIHHKTSIDLSLTTVQLVDFNIGPEC